MSQFSIENFYFITMNRTDDPAAPPRLPRTYCEPIVRPGVNGTGLLDYAVRGDPFEMRSVIDVVGDVYAHQLIGLYNTFIGQDSVALVWRSIDYDTLYQTKYLVLDMRAQSVRNVYPKARGLTAGANYLVEAIWLFDSDTGCDLMVTEIETGESIRAVVPAHVVNLSDSLAGPWLEEPFLYCDALRVCCGPEIDQARLSYNYGKILQIGEFTKQHTPLSVIGRFCQIVVPLAGIDGGDLIWYGVIEVDDRDVYGGGPTGTIPTGHQAITAYGLLRLLDRSIVRSSVVKANPAELSYTDPTKTVEMGLPFNCFRAGIFKDRGNRSALREGGDSHSFIFNDTPQKTYLWTASTAVEYLLEHNAPLDQDGDTLCAWKLKVPNNDLDVMDWYDVSVPTDMRTVKDVIDELLTRRRGIGYYVTFDRLLQEAHINAFSFLESDIELRDKSDVTGDFVLAERIAANPNTASLNFENALDIEARLVNQFISQYDRIVAQGDWATSTCTLTFKASSSSIPAPIIKDWTTDEQTEYFTAASEEAGYATLKVLKKADHNRIVRNSWKLRHVFRRFVLNPAWNQRTQDYDATTPTNYFAAPISSYDDDGTRTIDETYNSTTDNKGQPLWTQGIQIENSLPLRDRNDYSIEKIKDNEFEADIEDAIPHYLPPLIFVKTKTDEDPDLNEWEYLERLASGISNESKNRRWSGHIHILDQRAGFEIHLSGAPPHFISQASQIEMEQTEQWLDADKNGGINYGEDLRATLCLRLQTRVEEEAFVSVEAAPDHIRRTLYIDVQDARLDYVVPWTVVGIEERALQYSTSGGFIRDDRPRLADIARATAEWYGRPRQTIFFKSRQIKEFVTLGTLITEVGAEYKLTDVNTVITAISYDFARQPSTSFETSFAEMEFS